MSKRILAIGAGSKTALVLVGFLASALLAGLDARAADQHDVGSPALARVFAAWKARQEQIKSFHFVWDTRIVFPKGAFRFPRGRGLAGMRTGEDLDGGTHFEFKFPRSEWWGEGTDRLRSDFSKFDYESSNGWKETARFRITQEGSVNSRLAAPIQSTEAPVLSIWRKVPYKNPSNWLSSGDFLLRNREVDVQPLRFVARPLSSISEGSLENCRVISENARLGEANCIVIQLDNLDHSERWWVDRNRDFSVIRWERREPQAFLLDVAIDVKRHSKGEWVPVRWAFQLSQDKGGRPASVEARVTDYAINEKLPNQTFSPITPAGVRVYDVTVDLPIRDSDDRSGWLPDEEARKTLDAIAEAWLRTQARFKTFKFTWEQDSAPGTSFRLTKTVHVMSADGDKIALELLTPGWKRPAGARKRRLAGLGADGWAIRHSKTAFDGVSTRSVSFSEDQSDQGTLNLFTGLSRFYRDELSDPPLVFVVRPLDKIVGRIQMSKLRDPSKFHVVAGGGRIGDVACVIIETASHPGWQESYWLDPNRDYLPLRKHQTINGEDKDRVDWTYRLDESQGWIPIGWKNSSVGADGEVFGSKPCTVTSYSTNRPLPASEFEIEAPKRAQVQDARDGTRLGRKLAKIAADQAKLEAKMKATELARPRKPKPKAIYDPFSDAVTDVEAAMKEARQNNRRVLLEFGANWCPGCRDLEILLKENADVGAAVKKGFVLVLVDTDFDSGKKIDQKYVPKMQRNAIPHLAVLDSSGTVLSNDDVRCLSGGDEFDVAKIKFYLSKWSP